MITVNSAEIRGIVVGIINDYLNDKGVSLVDEARDEYVKGETDNAIIYGNKYDSVSNTVEHLVSMGDFNSIRSASSWILASFEDMFKAGKNHFFPSCEDIAYIINKINSELMSYVCRCPRDN